MVKFWLYSSASLVACAGLLWYTYMTRMQFYPAVIYLVTSKISVLILGNAGLVLTMLFGRLVKSIFLGTLRDAEVEILHENVRYAITETCLALTIFREEINFQVVTLFTSLIFLKVFHWLSQSRIEFIEQTDVVSRLTHMRLVALMTVLAAVDMTFVVICGLKVMETGPSVFILFGFEFLILFITLVAIFLRYVLYIIDARMDGNWANKFTYLFYLELVSEIIKLLIYLVFFMLIFTYYGMPLHIVRDLWMSIKNLQRRIASYFRYRKITANLNERFPNPTEEELQETDRTCIICREEMTAAACKKLPCSHIFHVDCLKMWVQRQQTCPTCRSTIPTGARPPVVPNMPAPAAAPAPPAHVPVPPPAHRQPVQAQAAAPAAGHTPAPVAAAAAQPAPAAGHTQHPHHPGQPGAVPPFAPGFPPFMSPFMFGPAMGAPFGYGLPPGYAVMPPFGFHPPAHGPAHAPQHGVPGVMADPASIQRQIEHLHAQLAALQAASHAYGVPHAPAVQVPPPNAPAATPSTLPMPSAPAPATSSPVPTPATAPSIAVPTTAATIVPPPSTATSAASPDPLPSTVLGDDLEEKAPIPAQSTEREERTPAVAVAEEAAIPRVLTEAERRREELRRRYNRIYSGNGSSSGAASSEDTKKDE